MPIPCNCNYHNPDIGWIINFIRQFREEQEDDFQKALDAYMQKYFNAVFADITYRADTETIVLAMSTVAEGDTHSYKDGSLLIV